MENTNNNEAMNLFLLRLFEELSTLEDEVEQLKNTVSTNRIVVSPNEKSI